MFQHKFAERTQISFPMTSYAFLYLKIKVLPFLTKPPRAIKHSEPGWYSSSFVIHVLQLSDVTSYMQISHPHLK